MRVLFYPGAPLPDTAAPQLVTSNIVDGSVRSTDFRTISLTFNEVVDQGPIA